jgi:type II secretory ATPase GspE/PulE/Tfp pilus assembly ATPase PilB-like protein
MTKQRGREEPVDFQPVEPVDMSVREAVESLIDRAAEMHASDLFLTSDEHVVGIAVRHLGIVMPLGEVHLAEGRRYMNYIKSAAGMDHAERRRPQDGRWIYRGAGGREIDLRVSIVPTLHGEDFCLRLLDRHLQLRSLAALGLLRHQQDELLAMLNAPSGLILVTGPAGSGKTTTLYACLNYLNTGSRKINTIEDPIEYAIPGVRQSQVNLHIDLDFPDLLQGVLRQSPDVIMLGEIRDPLTARTAIRAANSGHLVLATLHSPIAATAVQTMLALESLPHFLASSLRGVVSQRLVRTLCPACKTKLDISESPQTFAEVKAWLEPGQGNAIYSAAGCQQCLQTGYVNRTGVFEVLVINRELRSMIAQGRSAVELERQAIDQGMLEFRRVGLVKVAQGVTSTEEVLRVVPAEYLGIEM